MIQDAFKLVRSPIGGIREGRNRRDGPNIFPIQSDDQDSTDTRMGLHESREVRVRVMLKQSGRVIVGFFQVVIKLGGDRADFRLDRGRI